MNEKEAHAIEAHDDEALETHETEQKLDAAVDALGAAIEAVGRLHAEVGAELDAEELAEPECLHRWQLVRLCELCGEEERIFTDIFSENVPPTRTR